MCHGQTLSACSNNMLVVDDVLLTDIRQLYRRREAGGGRWTHWKNLENLQTKTDLKIQTGRVECAFQDLTNIINHHKYSNSADTSH